MNIAELAEQIAAKRGITKSDAKETIDTVFAAVADAAVAGEEISVPGFGKFKVASHLSEFFEEYRMYHRKKGQIVKEHDDILSAVRIAVMMKRYAKAVPLGYAETRRRSGEVEIAADMDLDVFASY